MIGVTPPEQITSDLPTRMVVRSRACLEWISKASLHSPRSPAQKIIAHKKGYSMR